MSDDQIVSTPSHAYASISLDILQDTLEFTFNSLDLALSNPLIYYETLASPIDVGPSIISDEKHGRVTVKLSKTLPADSKAIFKVAYEGKLLSNMIGYYKSVWEHDGKKDYYSLTQFAVTSSISSPPLTLSLP